MFNIFPSAWKSSIRGMKVSSITDARATSHKQIYTILRPSLIKAQLRVGYRISMKYKVFRAKIKVMFSDLKSGESFIKRKKS